MKRIITLFMIVCTVFALVGCGSNKKETFDFDFLLDTVTAQQVIDRYGDPTDTDDVYYESGNLKTGVSSYHFYYALAFQGYQGVADLWFESNSKMGAPIDFDKNELWHVSWRYSKGTQSADEYEKAVKKIVKAIKTMCNDKEYDLDKLPNNLSFQYKTFRHIQVEIQSSYIEIRFMNKMI